MNSLIKSLKEKVTQYIHLRIEDVRLEVIERLVNVMGYFAFVIISAFLFFFSFIFLGFALAAWLSELLGSRGAGFLITGALVFLIGLITVLLSKRVIRFFAGKLAYFLTRSRSKDDEDDESF